ncbi:hypothetical protein WICMUC_004770 [Wickerhamomyces mucosus]|uniref:Uncharacterized protein n=1 Tax=Wickerhamomyces mucosus TaxID=1378264 RepID=A0A9P8PH65_9ASCO|nr:hypothetical protein WICMUC_004770 [Wickerhamomyces mucosus]
MVDTSSIKNASELINSILYSKGYFNDKIKDRDNDNDQELKLLFKSIDTQLNDEIKIFSNDKFIINIIYQLLQDLDEKSINIQILKDQINNKDEEISNLEINQRNLQKNLLQNSNSIKIYQQNEFKISQKINQFAKNYKLLQKQYNDLKNLNNSKIIQKDLELKKQSKEINKLQDTLINFQKRRKKISIKTSSINHIVNNNFAFITDQFNNKDPDLSNNLLFDEELESLMNNLNNLIINLLNKNELNFKFIDKIKNYLELLLSNIKIPPTPQFFFQNYQLSNDNNNNNNNNSNLIINNNDDHDLSIKINKFVQLNENNNEEFLKILTEFYQIFINNFNPRNDDNDDNDNDDNDQINDLKNQIVELTNNLNSSYELNEKLKQKLGKKS